jgi:hypothetical protein
VQHAAAQLDESDEFHRDLAPTGCGIVRFDKPLPFQDIRGRTMLGHWLVWGPMAKGDEPGLMLTWFNDFADPDEVAIEQAQNWDERVMRALGRWMWLGADVVTNGEALGPESIAPTEEQADVIRSEGDVPAPVSNGTRYVHALFLLLNQTIVTVADEPVDRAARRRAMRKDLPGRVSVIALRRSESANRADGESLVEWNHRWLSRSYWRWQQYGPRKGIDHFHVYLPPRVENGHLVRDCAVEGCDNVVRRIIVRESIKGPADKPLVISDKVYSLER